MIIQILASYNESYYSWHNSWTQELLLEIISTAIEQLLNRNCTVDPALMPGSFEGVWGIWVITWLWWLSLMRDDDHKREVLEFSYKRGINEAVEGIEDNENNYSIFSVSSSEDSFVYSQPEPD